MTDEELILMFAGWRYTPHTPRPPYWQAPGGLEKWWLPVPKVQPAVRSLDWLFSWIVPHLWLCEMSMEDGEFFVWKVGHPDYGNYSSDAIEDAGQALFQAVVRMLSSK